MPDQHPILPARQPFTLGGVARFAHAPPGRLFLAAALFGLISGLLVSWLASTCWAPLLDQAISSLPPTGSIGAGILRWPEKTGRLLAANPFTSLEVVLDDFRTESAPVDFALEFRTNRIVVRSLFGARSADYPQNAVIELNRTALLPAWGAWKAPILFSLIPGTVLFLLLIWSALALPYSLIALVIGALFRREIDFRSAWKLSIAAQLPGSLLMAFALGLYATGQISLLFVLTMFAAHFVPTLFYLLISPCFLPKRAAISSEQNPFEPKGKRVSKGKNPFSGK